MNQNRKQEKVCPCCGRHCAAESLHCSRGMEYFGVSMTEEQMRDHRARLQREDENGPLAERVLGAMRRCGHYLHHTAGHGGPVDSEALLASLTEEEQQELLKLLGKCMQSWNRA